MGGNKINPHFLTKNFQTGLNSELKLKRILQAQKGSELLHQNDIRSSNGTDITCGKDIFILTAWVRAKTFNSDLVRKLLPPKESINVLLLPKVKEELMMKRALD